MIIKSSFKDYYDYVGRLYGGGDPKNVYVRNKLTEGDIICVDVSQQIPSLPDIYSVRYAPCYNPINQFKYKWLVVAGKRYMLFRQRHHDQWVVLDRSTNEQLFNCLKKTKTSIVSSRKDQDQAFLEIAKTLHAPVFCVTSGNSKKVKGQWRYTAVVEGKIPILATIGGFPKIMAAENVYQDIDYFMMNIIKPSPDIQPPAQVGEKERIQQHGFDLKTSFRHPVK